MAIAVVVALFTGCTQSTAVPLPKDGSGASKATWPTLDDQPEFECSPPPDNAVIYSELSSDDSYIYYYSEVNSLFMVGHLDLTSWVYPLGAEYAADGLSFGDITEEVDISLTIYGLPRNNPTWYQGEETTTQDARWGLDPSFYVSIHSYFDDELRLSSSYHKGADGVADLGYLCISHVREGRVAGVAGLLPRSEASVEELVNDIYVAFNSANHPFRLWDMDPADHPYESTANPRWMATTWTHYRGMDPAEVWSLPFPEDTGSAEDGG